MSIQNITKVNKDLIQDNTFNNNIFSKVYVYLKQYI